jgi:hypothetical protein
LTKEETLEAIIAGAKANGSWDKKYPDDDKKAQPAQEPVINGWKLREVYFDEHGEPIMHRELAQKPFGYLSISDTPIFQKEMPEIGQWETLYTTPQTRSWVGLTEQDLKPICDKWRIVYGAWVDDFAKDIEARLRSKNT